MSDEAARSAVEERLELSVVIPAYGGESDLARCLQAVERELAARPELACEIIVAEDAHPDRLSKALQEAHPSVNFLFGERNLGFSGNTNRGVEAARGRILCLLNTDMYVDPGFFDRFAAPFEDPSLFAVCGQINEPSGNNDGYKELSLGEAEAVLRTVPSDDPRSRWASYVPYANGGGSFFRRSMFQELGGFDPIFSPYYWEDTDLGYRAWKRGYKVLYDPRRSLVHDHQKTIGREKHKKVKRIFQRNRRLFLWRNNTALPLSRLVWATTIRPAVRALLQLRLVKAVTLLRDLRLLRPVVEARRVAYRKDLCSDSELPRLWAEPPPDHVAEASAALAGGDEGA